MARTLKDYPEISLKAEDLTGKIEFTSLFGRFAPVHIEIGSGKGTFLVSQAKAHSQVNFLGIEWANKYYRYSIDRIGRWELKNVRIIRADAAFFLADFVPDGSIECFHIYFPDPWPKKRHHKRRFLNRDNLQNLLRCLSCGGSIRIATDHCEYFRQIELVLSDQSERIKKIDFLHNAGAERGEWVGTNFERKYLSLKKQIYTIAVEKSSKKGCLLAEKTGNTGQISKTV